MVPRYLLLKVGVPTNYKGGQYHGDTLLIFIKLQLLPRDIEGVGG